MVNVYVVNDGFTNSNEMTPSELLSYADMIFEDVAEEEFHDVQDALDWFDGSGIYTVYIKEFDKQAVDRLAKKFGKMLLP